MESRPPSPASSESSMDENQLAEFAEESSSDDDEDRNMIMYNLLRVFVDKHYSIKYCRLCMWNIYSGLVGKFGHNDEHLLNENFFNLAQAWYVRGIKIYQSCRREHKNVVSCDEHNEIFTLALNEFRQAFNLPANPLANPSLEEFQKSCYETWDSCPIEFGYGGKLKRWPDHKEWNDIEKELKHD